MGNAFHSAPGSQFDPRNPFQRRFGTSRRDPLTGNIVPGEVNQSGRPMGSSAPSGMSAPMSANTMSSAADWRSRFPSTADRAAREREVLGTPGYTTTSRAPTAAALPASPAGPLPPGIAAARANPGMPQATPYGSVSVVPPARTDLRQFFPRNLANVPDQEPTPESQSLVAGLMKGFGGTGSTPAAPSPSAPVPAIPDASSTAERLGSTVGSLPGAVAHKVGAVNDQMSGAVEGVKGAADDFGTGLGKASPFLGSVWNRMVRRPGQVIDQGLNALRTAFTPAPADFPPEGQPGGRPGGTGRVADQTPPDFPPEGQPGGRPGGTGGVFAPRFTPPAPSSATPAAPVPPQPPTFAQRVAKPLKDRPEDQY